MIGGAVVAADPVEVEALRHWGNVVGSTGAPFGPALRWLATWLAWLCSAASSSERMVATVRQATVPAITASASSSAAAWRQARRRHSHQEGRSSF